MNRKVSVAPMMDCTDRHERYFLRLISKNVLLYTEMIVSEAIDRGDKKKLLSFNVNEKPLALQVGGSSPNFAALDKSFGEDPPTWSAKGFSFMLNDKSFFLSPLSIASETIISVYKRTFLLIKRKKYLS